MPSYYTARTDDELRRLAEQQYTSYYDQLRQAARQKQERESLALENQRAGIQRSYEKKREASDKSYRQAYSQVDRETLRRGMQRSSYAAQRLANVNQEGIEANQNIWDEQNTAEGNLDAQIAQLQGQLADTLAGYDANQAADVLKRYNELQAEEYDRAREAEQYAESIRQWQTQFDESVRQFNLLHPEAGAGGGGGYYAGGGGRSGGTKPSANNTPKPNDDEVKAAANALLQATTAAAINRQQTTNQTANRAVGSAAPAIGSNPMDIISNKVIAPSTSVAKSAVANYAKLVANKRVK